MSTDRVNIQPMPSWARKTKYRPLPPPVFTLDGVTHDDIELALALFEELDAESQRWYGGQSFVKRLRAALEVT